MKIFFGLILIFISTCVWAQNSDPIYKGKPESYWINNLTNIVVNGQLRNLSELGSNEVAVLLDAVKIENVSRATVIRTNAAILLGLKGDPAILIPLARTNFDPQVRAFALNALTFNADKSVTLTMIEALKDKSPLVRKAAVFGLGLTERGMIPEEVTPLAKCLQDGDAEICLQAAGILYSYPGGSEAAMPELEKMLKSRNADLKNAATDALKDYNLQKTLANQRATNILSPETNAVLDVPSANQKPATPLPIAPRDALGIFIYKLSVSYSEEFGKNWKATVKVIEEDGKPVQGADVSVIYYVPSPPDENEWSMKSIEGLTDANGKFIASHRDSCGPLGFDVQKAGYYSTHGDYKFLVKTNRNPVVTLVLKKIILP